MIDIIESPKNNWIFRVRKYHKIYDVKDNRTLIVLSKYEEERYSSLQIGCITLADSFDQRISNKWYCNRNGLGFNGDQILLPINSNILSNEEMLNDYISVYDVKDLLADVSIILKKVQNISDAINQGKQNGRFDTI